MSALATPTKASLFRALPQPIELIRSSDDSGMPTLAGYFVKWDEWAEIKSRVEGHFMERFQRGAFTKTFREQGDRMRCVFRHGLDPHIGDKVLGPFSLLDEDELGARYEVPLFDTSYNRDLLPGFEAGVYGSSFQYWVAKWDRNVRPRSSETNPRGIEERTILEAGLVDIGPCTFPVYKGTTTGVRSITDDLLREKLDDEPRNASSVFFPALTETSNDAETPERIEPLQTYDRAHDGESRLYARTLERVGAIAWEIHPDALATIVGIVAERANGIRLTDEEIRERIGLRADAQDPPSRPVAVLPLHGPIVPRASLFTETSGLTSVEEFTASFREALASEDVRAILLDIDSPGGDASLIPELSQEIRASRGEKPIVAVANTFAASAAYHIAAGADEIVVTPSGEVGSIGVYTVHDDLTAAQEKLGVKTTVVSAGKYKTERLPFEPLSDEAQSYMQEQVDLVYEMFVDDVAQGRGVDPEKVKNGFGEGRMVRAAKAVRLGMADRVATFDETLRRLEKSVAAKRSTEPEPSAASTPDKSKPEPQGVTTRSRLDMDKRSLPHGSQPRKENKLP